MVRFCVKREKGKESSLFLSLSLLRSPTSGRLLMVRGSSQGRPGKKERKRKKNSLSHPEESPYPLKQESDQPNKQKSTAGCFAVRTRPITDVINDTSFRLTLDGFKRVENDFHARKKKKKKNFDLHHLRHCKRHSYLGPPPPPLLTDPNRFCSVRAAESIFIR